MSINDSAMLILQVADPGGERMLRSSGFAIKRWAERHGHQHREHVERRKLTNPYTLRWRVIAQIFRDRRAEEVLYLDNDISPRRTDPFPAQLESTHIAFSSDRQGLCAGAFWIRRTQWSRWFVETALATIPDPQAYRTEDQDVLKILVGLRAVAPYVRFIPEAVIGNPTSDVANPILYHHWANADPEGVANKISEFSADRLR